MHIALLRVIPIHTGHMHRLFIIDEAVTGVGKNWLLIHGLTGELCNDCGGAYLGFGGGDMGRLRKRTIDRVASYMNARDVARLVIQIIDLAPGSITTG
jgi:hypothetical protein